MGKSKGRTTDGFAGPPAGWAAVPAGARSFRSRGTRGVLAQTTPAGTTPGLGAVMRKFGDMRGMGPRAMAGATRRPRPNLTVPARGRTNPAASFWAAVCVAPPPPKNQPVGRRQREGGFTAGTFGAGSSRPVAAQAALRAAPPPEKRMLGDRRQRRPARRTAAGLESTKPSPSKKPRRDPEEGTVRHGGRRRRVGGSGAGDNNRQRHAEASRRWSGQDARGQNNVATRARAAWHAPDPGYTETIVTPGAGAFRDYETGLPLPLARRGVRVAHPRGSAPQALLAPGT